MAYKITDERKKEIVNVIAEITTELKKFDEVECIDWCLSKEETLFTNFLDILQGNPWCNHVTKSGNLLSFEVITREREISSELRKAICNIREKYWNRKQIKKLGADIDFLTLPKKDYILYSDEDKKMINKLRSMHYVKDLDRKELIRFLNEEVYKGSGTVREMRTIEYLRGESREVPYENWLLISNALDDVYKYWKWPRSLHSSYITYDKTENGYYSKVQHQFDDYESYYTGKTTEKTILKKPLYSLNVKVDLNIIDDEVKLKLENNN